MNNTNDIFLNNYSFGSESANTEQKQKEETKQDSPEQIFDQGMEIAWETARKLYFSTPTKDLVAIFDTTDFGDVLESFSIHDVIDKMKTYEENKNLKVGDEVIDCNTKTNYIITHLTKSKVATLLKTNGDTLTLRSEFLIKTGRHFDIEALLQQFQSTDK